MGSGALPSPPPTPPCVMAHKVDPYEEINEATDLADDEIKCLKNCFDLFDSKKQTFLSADDLDEILRAMGFRPSAEELAAILAEIGEGFITMDTLRGSSPSCCSPSPPRSLTASSTS